MVNYRSNEVSRWTPERLGKELAELEQAAKECDDRASELEGEAKGLRCKAARMRRDAHDVLRFRCPSLKLEADTE